MKRQLFILFFFALWSKYNNEIKIIIRFLNACDSIQRRLIKWSFDSGGLALVVDRMWSSAYIFHGIAFGISSTLIPLYFVESLNGSLIDFGVMSSLAMLLSILASVYAGMLPEKYGRTKPFILISFILSGLILFGLSQVRSILLFQILYVLLGTSNSIYSPATRILISESYDKDDWSKMFAWHGLIVGLSNTVGLAICSLFVASIGYATLLFLCGPLVLASSFVGFVVIRDPPFFVERLISRLDRPVDDLVSVSYWLGSKSSPERFGIKTELNTTLFAVGTLFLVMASSSAFSSLPIFFSKVTIMAPQTIFTLFFIRSIVGSVSYVVVGRLLGVGDRALKLASVARALIAVLMPAIVFLPLLTPVIATLLLSGETFSWTLYALGSTMIIVDYAAEGTAGVYDALGNLGNVMGILFSGLIPGILGFNALFIFAFALFSIASLAYWKGV